MDVLHSMLVFVTGLIFGGLGSIIVVSAVIIGRDEQENEKKSRLTEETIKNITDNS